MRRDVLIALLSVFLLLLFAGTSFADGAPSEIIYEQFSIVPPYDWELQNHDSVTEWSAQPDPDGDPYTKIAAVESTEMGKVDTLLISYPLNPNACMQYSQFLLEAYIFFDSHSIPSECKLTFEINQKIDNPDERQWSILKEWEQIDESNPEKLETINFEYYFDNISTNIFDNTIPFELGFRYSGINCPFIAIDDVRLQCSGKLPNDDDDDDDDNDDNDDDNNDNDNDTGSDHEADNDEDDDDGCCGC